MTQTVDVEALRVAVYRSFADTGHAPETGDLARLLDCTGRDVAAGLRELGSARHLVLDEEGVIVMAHPFASIPLGFSVMGASTLWWGGCAWDSFAIPHLVPEQAPVLVATRCPGCRRPLVWEVGIDVPPVGDEVAHFLVPAARMWDDVVHTCSHQSLFCSSTCVDDWLDRTGALRGYVMDLSTLWRFAQNWYAGRLDRGYTRREPSQAQDYMRSAGLAGAFWGLED